MDPLDPHESPVTPNGEPPSKDQLVRTVAIAGIIAVVALLLFVLPAEYGIDPTGFGTAIGLGQEDSPDTAAALNVQDGNYREENWTFNLADGGRWFEFKLEMAEGMGFVYSWNATSEVRADFHHDTIGSFDDQVAMASSGTFTAPADGNYGWAWRSPSDEAVTIQLRVIGYWAS